MVDSFRFLPRIIAAFYRETDLVPEMPIPWTPLSAPLKDCKFGLITSGGLYHLGEGAPFDLEREKREPTWGDPSYRTIPTTIKPDELGVSHLHINPRPVMEDMNVLLPIHRFQELEEEGVIGGLGERAYSFMGYQGFPPDASQWRDVQGPQVARLFKAEGVDCVLLTPA